jgi:hypothetical protein
LRRAPVYNSLLTRKLMLLSATQPIFESDIVAGLK